MPRREKQPFVRVTFPWWRERKANKEWTAKREALIVRLEAEELTLIECMRALRQLAHEYDDKLTFVC